MIKKYKRSNKTICIIKITRFILLGLGIATLLLPFYLAKLPKFKMSEDYFYFIVFPLISILSTWPVLVIKKTLKEIESQYIKISDSYIESQLYNNIHHIKFSDVINFEKKGNCLFIQSETDRVIIGDFEDMSEISLNLDKKIIF